MLATAEASVLHNINAALETLGSPRIVRVAEMFEGVPALMSTFAELDHYGPRAHATYVGPIGLRQLAHEAAWREIGGPRILAYLRPALPCLEAALGAMNKFPGEVICVVPGLSPTLARRFASPRMRLFDRPISVPDLLPKADLVVSYGGAATVAGSLLAGAPLLLASHTVEQHMVTVRVAEVGAGVVLTRERSERDFVRALAEATANPGYKAAARRFADRYSTFTEARAIERVTSVLESAARSVQ
jgi:UDP:flavonoid glycosyltransferase YjiC (YdhE family)